MATLAISGMLGMTALLPFSAAASTGPGATTNFFVAGHGSGWGYGWGGVNPNNLGQLFVLGTLFRGPYGNGVLSPIGTTLGDLLIVNQIFNGYGYGW